MNAFGSTFTAVHMNINIQITNSSLISFRWGIPIVSCAILLSDIYVQFTRIIFKPFTDSPAAQLSDFADATASSTSSTSSTSAAHHHQLPGSRSDIRTLLDMHKKRNVLPTLQRNGNANSSASSNITASTGGGHATTTSGYVVVDVPNASGAESPQIAGVNTGGGSPNINATSSELNSLFGSMQAKKKSMHAYERSGSNSTAAALNSSGAITSTARNTNAMNASSSNSSINQASTLSTSSQQVCLHEYHDRIRRFRLDRFVS